MKTINVVLTAVLLTIPFVACKKSVKGESSSWNSNRQKVATLKSAYPAFAPALDANLKDAERVWAESDKISDEETKAKKMDEANGVLEHGITGKLGSADYRFSTIDRKQRNISSMKFPSTALPSVNRTMSSTVTDLAETHRMLDQGAATPQEAQTLVENVNGRLITIEGNLDRAIRLGKR